jgi:hypothetical protein
MRMKIFDILSGVVLSFALSQLVQARNNTDIQANWPQPDKDGVIKVQDFIAQGVPACEALQEAIDNNAGGTIKLPPRPLLLDTIQKSCSIVIRSAVAIEGTRSAERGEAGSALIQSNSASSLFVVDGKHAAGTRFAEFSVMQQQPPPTTGEWLPVAYPPMFDIRNVYGEVIFQDILAKPVYTFINSVNSGRLQVTGIRGQILSRFVSLDQSLDVSRFYDIHLWNYWSGDSKINQWQQKNLDVFYFGRVSHPMMDNIFAFAARSLVRSYKSRHGSLGKLQAGSLACDFCQYGLWFEGNNVSVQIASLSWQGEAIPARNGSLDGARAIFQAGDKAYCSISSLIADRSDGPAIEVRGSNNSIDILSSYYMNNLQPKNYQAHIDKGRGNDVRFLSAPVVR